MKARILTIIFITTTWMFIQAKQKTNQKPYCAITYDIDLKCRFGDHVVAYSKAKWLSYKYHLPLFYTQFPYSDELMLSKCEKKLTLKSAKNFKNIIKINSEDELDNKLKIVTQSTIFRINILTRLYEHINANLELHSEGGFGFWVNLFIIDFMAKFPEFDKQLKQTLQPLHPLSPLNIPKNKTTVAVHIRKGSNNERPLSSIQYHEQNTNAPLNQAYHFNKKYADHVWPHKFPPEQFYVDQIVKLSELLNDAPMYVHIFSDDPDITNLTERIEQKVNKSNITFGYKAVENAHSTNVIQDCFEMAQFDCLIRSCSHFSWVSQLIGHHKIVIHPLHLKWIDDQNLIVDKVNIIFNK